MEYHVKKLKYIKKDGTLTEYTFKQKYISRKRNIDDYEIDSIVSDIKSGLSITEIKNKYNINNNTLLNICFGLLK